MTIKDLGPRVASIWEGLRPKTRKLLVGVLKTRAVPTPPPEHRYSYDAHADWELSRLLSALDEQSTSPDYKANDEILNEISALADTCVRVLESQSGSAEVFIQLAERAIRKHDYNKLDTLSDRLAERFSSGEIAEIVRQTELPQIRAIAYETLAMLPVELIVPLLDDSLYAEIAAIALEQKAFEFESEEARDALEQYDYEMGLGGE
jgi:hypothetical protein